MSDLVQVYFIVSIRNHRSGKVSYNLSDNLTKLPRGGRRVYGTGHYDRDIVLSRMRKCKSGTWFKEQHKERTLQTKEDLIYRKKLHTEFLKSQKRRTR